MLISKSQLTKALADHVSISVEDLNDTELAIIDKAHRIILDCLSEQKALEDEVKRLGIELANLKAMQDTGRDLEDEEDGLY